MTDSLTARPTRSAHAGTGDGPVFSRRCNILVLKRKRQERIRITTASGEEVWITVVDAGDGWARIGIEADRSIVISREELIPVAEDHATTDGG